MKYEVRGAHKDTGDESLLTIEAPTPTEAADRAASMGFYVSDVRPAQLGGASRAGSRHPAGTPGTVKVQTIQKTGKVWKAMGLVGFLLLATGLACIVIFFANAEKLDDGSGSDGWLALAGLLGFLGTPVGLLTLVIARIGAWWNHG